LAAHWQFCKIESVSAESFQDHAKSTTTSLTVSVLSMLNPLLQPRFQECHACWIRYFLQDKVRFMG